MNFFGKLQLRSQINSLQSMFALPEIYEVSKQNMQQCTAKFATDDFCIKNFTWAYWDLIQKAKQVLF